MLRAHPAILRNLLQQYEDLRAQDAGTGTVQTRREWEEVAYTLCVSTGALTVEAALAAAEQQLTAALTTP